ncbi:MAG TPA: putative porin, partial [Geobacteraceae bacterium]|nr:putative porin [Geobacteraceae bacterium]
GDFVKNLAFNRGDVEAIAFQEISLDGPVSPGDTGYQVGVTVGYPTVEKFGDWKGLLFYKHLESDAVIDAFTDQDFHLGGTNAKGWIVGGDFGLTKNVWLSTRWYTADQISGPPLAIDIFQFNLNAKF